MVYAALDDRPSKCEGCSSPDYPSLYGPSTRQITWNNVLGLWLCVECQYQWSNWFSARWSCESARNAGKPGFIILMEKESGKS